MIQGIKIAISSIYLTALFRYHTKIKANNSIKGINSRIAWFYNHIWWNKTSLVGCQPGIQMMDWDIFLYITFFQKKSNIVPYWLKKTKNIPFVQQVKNLSINHFLVLITVWLTSRRVLEWLLNQDQEESDTLW